jgi:hypothetical protein
VNGLTDESENALPLDSKFWDYARETEYSVAIPVSDKKMLNIIGALEDIYHTISEDPDESKECLIMLAAIFVASSQGRADEVWEEFAVRESMKSFDTDLKEILNERL